MVGSLYDADTALYQPQDSPIDVAVTAHGIPALFGPTLAACLDDPVVGIGSNAPVGVDLTSNTAARANLARASEAVRCSSRVGLSANPRPCSYHLDDEMVSWKAAAFPEKDFISKTGGKLCFYNLDNALSGCSGTRTPSIVAL